LFSTIKKNITIKYITQKKLQSGKIFKEEKIIEESIVFEERESEKKVIRHENHTISIPDSGEFASSEDNGLEWFGDNEIRKTRVKKVKRVKANVKKIKDTKKQIKKIKEIEKIEEKIPVRASPSSGFVGIYTEEYMMSHFGTLIPPLPSEYEEIILPGDTNDSESPSIVLKHVEPKLIKLRGKYYLETEENGVIVRYRATETGKKVLLVDNDATKISEGISKKSDSIKSIRTGGSNSSKQNRNKSKSRKSDQHNDDAPKVSEPTLIIKRITKPRTNSVPPLTQPEIAYITAENEIPLSIIASNIESNCTSCIKLSGLVIFESFWDHQSTTKATLRDTNKTIKVFNESIQISNISSSETIVLNPAPSNDKKKSKNIAYAPSNASVGELSNELTTSKYEVIESIETENIE